MNRLQIRELVIVGVDAHAEEQPRVSPIYDLRGAELDEVGLMLLVSGRDEAVDLAFEFDFLFILIGKKKEKTSVQLFHRYEGRKAPWKDIASTYTVWRVPFCETGFPPVVVKHGQRFSSL